MQSMDARRRANTFFALHAGPQALVLVDVWDAVSARLVEHAGARAIGTSSAAMAWSLGYSGAEDVPVREFVAACGRICRVVDVPVTVEIGCGLGRDTEEVCTLVRRLIEVGIAGVTIADGVLPGTRELGSPAALCERIEALRALTTRMSTRLFINAGIATYRVADRDRGARFHATVRRAEMYASAGADGVFVPAIDPEAIAPFTRAVKLPVTVGAGDGWAPPIHGLHRVGVRRISLGHGPLQASLAVLRRVATEALDRGTYDTMSRTMLSPSEVEALFPIDQGAPGGAGLRSLR